MIDELALGELGLTEALARLREAADADDRTHVYLALGECLMWLRALDELQVKVQTGQLKGSEEGLLRGFRYVANRVLHQLARPAHLEVVISTWGSGAWGVGRWGTESWNDFRWPPLAKLPRPDQRDEGGAAAYEQHLAGNSVEGTFLQAQIDLGLEPS